MERRVYSLETEYALAYETPPDSPKSHIAPDRLYELLEAEILKQWPHAKCDPTGRQSLSETSLVEICEGYFLANGARLYYDTGHLEWAAPETGDPYQAVVYDRASDSQLSEIAGLVARQLGGRPLIIKNNLDYQSGVTYGCHENYSVRRYSSKGRDVMRQIVDRLIPFLVTRQILCGAGRIDAACDPYVGFQLSQRADFMTRLSSVDTRENRPLVNLRDEPLGDGRHYARLHLILGDSNMAEYATFLKLGITGLLLDMLETDTAFPNLKLENPPQALREVSRDLEFRQELALADGGTATALEIQRAYWLAARNFVAVPDREDRLAQCILQLWGKLLTDLEHRSADLEYRLDWAIKRRVFGEMLQQFKTTWEEVELWMPVLARTWQYALPQHAPNNWGDWIRKQLAGRDWAFIETCTRQNKLVWQDYKRFRHIVATLRMIDLRYHDIHPKLGIFYQYGQADTIINNPEECAHARQTPPDTRAAVRAHALRLADQCQQTIRMDWDRIYFDGRQQELGFPDPLNNDITAVEKVFAPFVKRPKASQPLKDEEIEIVVLEVEEITAN